MENLLGEFIGTLVLCTFGDGVCACCLLNKSKGQGTGWVLITLAWGFAVMMGVYAAVACGAPQADINPAVTLTKMLGGVYTPFHAFMTMIAETAGAFCAGVIVWLAYLPHWKETDNKGAKLGIFATGPAIRNAPANFITEMIGTIFLVVIIMFIFSKNVVTETGLAVGLGPVLVGLLVVVIGMSLGGPTGYAINPARDLGPRIAHAVLPISGKGHSDWGYAWIPIFGPFAGAVVAYLIVKALGVAFV